MYIAKESAFRTYNEEKNVFLSLTPNKPTESEYFLSTPKEDYEYARWGLDPLIIDNQIDNFKSIKEISPVIGPMSKRHMLITVEADINRDIIEGFLCLDSDYGKTINYISLKILIICIFIDERFYGSQLEESETFIRQGESSPYDVEKALKAHNTQLLEELELKRKRVSRKLFPDEEKRSKKRKKSTTELMKKSKRLRTSSKPKRNRIRRPKGNKNNFTVADNDNDVFSDMSEFEKCCDDLTFE